MAFFGFLALLSACDTPVFVDRVVIVNETVYSANVDVRGETGGWLGLATVSAGGSRTVGRVIDQGRLWTFRFSYGSHDSIEITVSREALAGSGWRVEVPAELEQKLRAEGVPPPP